MKNFKNILVYLDGQSNLINSPAIQKGRELVMKNQGQMTLMDVIQPPQDVSQAYQGIFSTTDLFNMFVRCRKDDLSTLAAQLNDEGIQTSSRVTIGRPFIEIIRQMQGAGHDLFIKDAALCEQGFDSQDFHLLRKSAHPLWLLRENSDANEVLVTVDLAQESQPEGRLLNRHLVRMAQEIAQTHNQKLHLLSCWTLYGEDALRNSGFMRVSKDKLHDMMLEECQKNADIQEALVDEFPDTSIQLHLLKGDPTEVIPQFIQNHPINLVVMSTVSRSDIPGLFIGATSEQLLQKLTTSVLAMKPDGFQSPVE